MNLSRRSFIQKSAITTGMVSVYPLSMSQNYRKEELAKKKHLNEVWIASFSQAGLYADTVELMMTQILEKLKELESYHPDFVCLPEIFPFSHTRKEYSDSEKIAISKTVIDTFSAYSKEHKCYTICPVFTEGTKGEIYISAVVLNKDGEQIGIYKKIHVPEVELKVGITPGPFNQPAIETDFGKIGIQICNDIHWDDEWSMLKQQGAKIIFWVSAFGGGRMINAKALKHKCVVVTSTQTNSSKICDITGDEIISTGFWNSSLCYAPVNLDKIPVFIWPNKKILLEIGKKYGRKVKINFQQDEGIAIIESYSSDVYVKDILKEFDLKSLEEQLKRDERLQQKARQKI